jgi:hypothetical protein
LTPAEQKAGDGERSAPSAPAQKAALLRQAQPQPPFKYDGKLRDDIRPVTQGHRPFLRYRPIRQVQQFPQGVVVEKSASSLRHFAKLPVQIFHGIGGINDGPDLLGIFKEGR